MLPFPVLFFDCLMFLESDLLLGCNLDPLCQHNYAPHISDEYVKPFWSNTLTNILATSFPTKRHSLSDVVTFEVLSL